MALAVALRALAPGAWHDAAQYANDRIDADHARLKAGLLPMRGQTRPHRRRWRSPATPSSRTCRGHYKLGTCARKHLTVAAAFDELTAAR